MAIRRWWTTVRDSLWFVPAIWVVVSAALAFGLIAIDSATPDFATRFPLIFGGGAEGARGLLSSIAGSMITVAGVTFSITIVALQLASSQFSPRVLRTFMRDRPSQIVLGSFIGAFTYSILVLRSIRNEESDATAFVPSLAVTVGIIFSLVALAMLVYFIHHIATRIQVSTTVANIAEATTRQVDEEWPEEDERVPPLPDGEPGIVLGRDSGYLQIIGRDELVEAARTHDIVVRLDVRTGEWVQAQAPLFAVWPAAAARREEVADALIGNISLGGQRSIEQDAAFGIRQLVDVAVKAISPGINDPTTATDCINRIGQILVAVGNRSSRHVARRDDDGNVRLFIPYRRWSDHVDLAFDQLRQYSLGSTDISIALLRTLRTIARAVPADRRPELRLQAEAILAGTDEIPLEVDRRRVQRVAADMLAT